MTLAKLVEDFSVYTELPIEIEAVKTAIINLGIQDEIVFCPDDKMDVTVLRGIYYR